MQATTIIPTRPLSLAERVKAIANKRTLQAQRAADIFNSGLIPVLPKEATAKEPTPAARLRLGAGSARAAAMVAAAIASAEAKYTARVIEPESDSNSDIDYSEASDDLPSVAKVQKELATTWEKEDLLPRYNKRKHQAGTVSPNAKMALKNLRAKRNKKEMISRSPSPPSPYTGILTSTL
jgi:hypothetical protein